MKRLMLNGIDEHLCQNVELKLSRCPANTNQTK